jgi:glutathione synthase/RimK-type ligase-like ATP-grasp enzyme
VWDDPRVDWSAARAVVIRSAWDSHLRRDAFLAWARKVGKLTRLFNPPEVLRWNTHKGYLRALTQAGLAVTPTHFLTRAQDLQQLAHAEGWRALVLKPCVSAGALDTHVFTREALPAAQAVLARLLEARGEVMVQPYLESFEREGERSYLFFGGAFSHAVRRPPGLQDTPRAFSEPSPLAPDPAELALAEAVVAASGGAQLLYARVDVATGADGRPLLQELEATEPRLFLLQESAAAARLAEALVRRL